MLDTNVASEFIKSTRLDDKMLKIPLSSLAISSITEAELLYGTAKKPRATKLHQAVHTFLQAIDIYKFDSAAAASYANLRSEYEAQGLAVGNLDALIAAHARSAGMTLVTNDGALLRLNLWIDIEQW